MKKYDFIAVASDGDLTKVELNNRYGYINKQGQEVIPCIYQEICGFEGEENALFKLDNKWGFINNKGVQITPLYEDAYSFYNGYAMVKKDGKWGYINTQGQEVISCRYEEMYIFDYGSGNIQIQTKLNDKIYNLKRKDIKGVIEA